ncbi:MAG: AAA family ATPase, partial [Gammaproteobacteria bacterium]|nr:AAA family ATPase [Gammaproteobacteria bacterium]
MRSEIRIENYRGIAQGSLKGLAPLTVLVGRNNSGKSTILEALRFGGGEPAAQVAAELSTKRGWSGFGCIKQLAYDSGKPFRITLKAGDDESSWEIGLLTGVNDLVEDGMGWRRHLSPEDERGLSTGKIAAIA